MKNVCRGFTILEVMFAAAISTAIVFGVFALLQASNKQLQIMDAKMSLQEGPREALFKMAQEVRQTAKDKLDQNGWVAGADNVERANTLSFIVPVPAPDEASLVDSHFLPKWAGDVRYALDETTHQILRSASDGITTRQAVLANDVTALEFSREINNPGLITIRVETQKRLSNGRNIPETPLEMTAQAEARNS